MKRTYILEGAFAQVNERWMNHMSERVLRGRIHSVDVSGYFPLFCFESETGEQYYDLPSSAFGIREYHARMEGRWAGVRGEVSGDTPEFLEENREGVALIDKEMIPCRFHGGFLWHRSDVLLWLISCTESLYLWPVHKVRFSRCTTPLPDWRRNRL